MTDSIGPFIIDLAGEILSQEEQEILAHPLVGGVILFTRNYSSREQLKELCRTIRLSRPMPLLIMADQEGGRVQRFINQFTRLPSPSVFGKTYDEDPHKACLLAKDCGWLMATELLSVGIDLSLSPVLDLNKGISHVIGDRAFHVNVQAVIQLANAFIHGMREAGMAAIGKHFPGHGAVALDSHIANPIDNRSLSEIERDDMLPFTKMIKTGLHAVMTAHIVYPQIDERPVSFSRMWLFDILRTRLGFTGTILSDDLNMKAADISINYADRVLAAREAGCDFIMLCNNRPGVIQVLDNVPSALHQVNKEKWGILQGNVSYVTSCQIDQRWQKTQEFLLSMA